VPVEQSLRVWATVAVMEAASELASRVLMVLIPRSIHYVIQRKGQNQGETHDIDEFIV